MSLVATWRVHFAGGVSGRDRQARVWGILLVPALLVLSGMTIVPTLLLVATSLTPLDLTRPQTWWDFSDPLANYAGLRHDARFLNSVTVQAKLSLATVVIQVLLGLAVALALNAHVRLRNLLRTLLVLPMVVPPIVAAILWKILFTPDISPVMWLAGTVGLPQQPWLVDPELALWAIIVADTWQWTPFVTLILLAALQFQPTEPVEAAAIDGATDWQLFWYVTLPFLRPALAVVTLFRVVDSLKAFPLIYVMTGGGPAIATEVPNYYAFQQAFSYSYLGSASAIALLLLAGGFAISWVITRSALAEADLE